MADPDPRQASPIELFFDRRVVTMLFLGFSAGIPLLLIFSSLSLWLREAGAERAALAVKVVVHLFTAAVCARVGAGYYR